MVYEILTIADKGLTNVQGGSSGRGTQFVDIKLKVQPRHKLLTQKRNSILFQCQQKLVIDQMDHPVVNGPFMRAPKSFIKILFGDQSQSKIGLDSIPSLWRRENSFGSSPYPMPCQRDLRETPVAASGAPYLWALCLPLVVADTMCSRRQL